MAFNPWGNNDENTSFEQGSPITQTTKNAAKAVSSQVAQQQKAFSKSLNDQLYGPSTDASNQQGDAAAKKDQPPSMATIQKQMPQSTGDEKQLEETRKKLQEFQRQHRDTYFNPTMGEEAHKKQEAEKKQQEQEQLQEEEAKRQQLTEEQAAQEQNLGGVAPHGKTTGRNRMQKPVALTQAKTKTEVNRGTTG